MNNDESIIRIPSLTDDFSYELNKMILSSTYGKMICHKCGSQTWDIYQVAGKPTTCTFCQASEMELTKMDEGYPDTIKVLVDLYAAFLDNWASYNTNLRDGVAILYEANTLGWELDYVRDKWTEDLELIPGHVIARKV